MSSSFRFGRSRRCCTTGGHRQAGRSRITAIRRQQIVGTHAERLHRPLSPPQIIDPRTRRIIASSEASDPAAAIAHWVEQAVLPNNSEHLSLEAGGRRSEPIIARQMQDPEGHVLALLVAAQPYEMDAGISSLAEHNLGQTGAIYLYDWLGS